MATDIEKQHKALAEREAKGKRCPKVSHTYGEQCEQEVGHDGPCFGASMDGFYGCDPKECKHGFW